MTDADQFHNIEMLDLDDAADLIERLNDAYWDEVPHD
jgi:hypothetical protein